MMNYELGEVVLLTFPQTDLRATSKRPALVLFDGGDVDLVVSRITSQPQIGKTEYKIVNWQKAGLLFESWVRVGKIATLDKSLIDRK
ncbi:MAG: type II toxin-antitoxin system PemK/MazF family toxin, partial [bacterium]